MPANRKLYRPSDQPCYMDLMTGEISNDPTGIVLTTRRYSWWRALFARIAHMGRR